MSRIIESLYRVSGIELKEDINSTFENIILDRFSELGIRVVESYHDIFYPDREKRNTIDCFVVEISKPDSEKIHYTYPKIKEFEDLEKQGIHCMLDEITKHHGTISVVFYNE